MTLIFACLYFFLLHQYHLEDILLISAIYWIVPPCFPSNPYYSRIHLIKLLNLVLSYGFLCAMLVQTWWHWFSLACIFFFFISIILKIYWQSKSALAINTGHELPHKNNNVLTELQYMRACSQQQHTLECNANVYSHGVQIKTEHLFILCKPYEK